MPELIEIVVGSRAWAVQMLGQGHTVRFPDGFLYALRDGDLYVLLENGNEPCRLSLAHLLRMPNCGWSLYKGSAYGSR